MSPPEQSKKSKHRLSDTEDNIDSSPFFQEEPMQTMNDFSNSRRNHGKSIWVKLGLKKQPLQERWISFPFENSQNEFSPNVIKNQKYNWLNFLPLVLFEQFKFFFNLYFLLVALSQLIPALQIGYLFTYFAPLSFVLLVTISKEAYDDWKRYQRDLEANSQKYYKLTITNSWTEIPSAQIRVGDIIKVEKNQRVPADLVLLKTTEKSGACFVRTDQLDGETDWKLRIAVPATQRLPEDGISHYRGMVYAEKPHKDIYHFEGTLTWQQHTEPLSAENCLWTNTVLASGTALGLVVYTGRETRAVLNTSHPATKVGKLDLEINLFSKFLFLLCVCLSFVLIALNEFNGPWFIYWVRFMILFSSIIPISLRVNLDLGKTVYAYQIMKDKEIPGTIVRTSTIPEELGRIEYLMTDKTGTLTKNEMELKKVHLGTVSYGIESLDDVHRLLVSGLTHQPQRHSVSGGHFPVGKKHREISARMTDLILALAICHNVTPVIEGRNDLQKLSRGHVTYQASSPDEVAIVQFTEQAGLMLAQRDMHSMTLKFMEGKGTHIENLLLHFDILHVFPFTSETKRMGIVVRDRKSNEIFFYQKGADVVMTKLVQYNDWLDEECGNMAREGLRTLVIARKRLTEEHLKDFEQQYHQAKVSLQNRQENVQAVISKFLESELELLGLTGVEDKLQDDVKSTLEIMRNAGIRIWMLTGDKIETATNIAQSSKLVSRNQTIFQVQKLTSILEAEEALDKLMMSDACLVMDGHSLQFFLDHMPQKLMQTAIHLPAVVCCRCSPTQKALVTTLIRQSTRRKVCAIGDGGNDVSMIQAADVGIGIVGKEGKQASLAADFSINQFSYLSRLLLWHGRNSYKRSAKLAQFVIHRGLIISVMQAVFSALFYFAPIALYQGMLIVGYSTIYTMAPVFSLVLDQDVTDEIALIYPELYKDLIKGRILSLKTFFQWVMISVYQGGAIMLLALLLFEDDFLNIVSISFTALIFNELLMVAFEITTWHRLMIYAEILTVFVYLLSMYFLKTDFDLEFILTWRFVWKSLLITVVSCFPLYIIRLLKRHYAPPIYTKLSN